MANDIRSQATATKPNLSDTSGGCLNGLKVIDLTRVLGGPYATMILADHGADVIKVEGPGGDDVRDWGPPFLEHANGTRDASYFLGVNRNKRSIGIDLSTVDGRAVLMRLLEDADILIENFKPGTMEEWGLGFETISRKFPALIYCRLSGFGNDGPLGGMPGYDAIAQAMVGLMSINGDTASGPMRVGTAVIDMVTGLYSAVGILMALHERTRSGSGQFLDMTLHDCGMTILHPHATNYFLSGNIPQGTGNPHPNIAPYEAYPTRTGLIFVASGNEGQFRTLCTKLGLQAILEDDRFSDNASRLRNRTSLTEILANALRKVDGEALCLELLRAGVPAGPVRNIEQVVNAPHTAARKMIVRLGRWIGFGTPIKLNRTPGQVRREPPQYSEHYAEILSENGFTGAEIDRLVRSSVVVSERMRPRHSPENTHP